MAKQGDIPISEIQPSSERSILARIFLSPDERRLRAGWRLLLQTILFFLFGTILLLWPGLSAV